MEPVTHILAGECLARAGLNRKAAYTTVAMALAAEFPDIDTLWSLRGPVEGFQHHRGITHTFLGIPFEAALLTLLFWGIHRWRMRRAQAQEDAPPLTAAPVRWGWLYAFLLLALLSHLALDYTNNYGLRPFFPFNPRWYAGSFVFIFDPLLFFILLMALGLPSLFRLISREVGERKRSFNGRGLARVALVCIAAYYGLRAFEHGLAVQIAMAQTFVDEPIAAAVVQLNCPPQSAAICADPAPAAPQILRAQRVLVSPDPLSPFRWYAVTDFGPLYHLDEVDSWRGFLQPGDTTERKADASAPVIRAAFESPLGRAYLDWSSMPWIELSLPPDARSSQPSIVFFRDPRFMGDALLLHSQERTPLTGTVELDSQNRVQMQTLDGKEEQP